MALVIQLEQVPPDSPSGGVGQNVGQPPLRTEQPRQEQLPRHDQPKKGLLSQTMIPSPIIQWILPARLRSRHHNDVAFIGERRLQIKEAVSGIHLEDAIAKTDFDANIVAAKVINVDTQLPLESQMKLGAGTTAATGLEMHDDSPPQILLLSLDSRELVFLYYSCFGGGQFIHYHRALPADVSSFETFGRNVAVDPRSRAIAVGAPCDYFGVFMLKKPAVLQSQMAENCLDPISEERFFRVDGDILNMEFLYPTPEDGDRIILLLLIALDLKTYAVCYDWDNTHGLRNSTPRITKRVVPPEYRLPSIVIPCTMASSFILATSTSMISYKNRLDPGIQPIQYPLSIPDQESQRSPLCTRWARPVRNLFHNKRHDDIYLCREDGTIFYLEIGSEGDVQNQFYLGRLDCDVDTAFDILDVAHEGADLILAAGNMGDGGLFIQPARDQPRCVQRFMNWSPITDSVIVHSTPQNSLATDTAYDRLFVCSASTVGHGGLAELRHGIEAQVGLVVSVEELLSAGNIWAIADVVSGGVYILTSDPESSLLFYLQTGAEEEICAVDESESGLDFSTHTLAAGCAPCGTIVQVTEKAIQLGVANESSPSIRVDYHPDQSVAAAAINESGTLVITAARSQQGIHLHLTAVISYGDGNLPQLHGVGSPVSINEEPICALVEHLGSAHFVFIGSGDGNVLTYRADQGGLTFLCSTTIEVDGDDMSKAIESLATTTIATSRNSVKSTLLCGLRSGILIPFEMTFDSSNTSTIGMRQVSPQRLGQTSVKVQSRGRFALATCGKGFWQVSRMHDGDLSEYALQKVLITDQNDPAYYPNAIHSFTTSNVFGPNLQGHVDSLCCIADGQLLICTLDQAAKVVPRRISLPGSASRVAYSKHLKSLVVAYTRTKLETDTNPIRRITYPYIEFVDPDSTQQVVGSVGPEHDDSQQWRPQGAAGEKITHIMEWMPKKDGEEYHFIVIGTARKTGEDRGRVIFLLAYRDPSNPSQIKCSVKHIHKFDGPVHTIAPYGDLTLMVGSGNYIIPLIPNFAGTQSKMTRYLLMSPAVSITVREPYLYVSSSRQSLVVLEMAYGRLMQLYAQDRQKLDGLSHVHFGEPKFTLTSSRGGRVSLLGETGVPSDDMLLPSALVNAHLPVSVTKLLEGTRPSPLAFPKVVYGTTITGAVYRLSILNGTEWRLLRLLQNICISDPILSPFMPKKKRRSAVESKSPHLPSRMHIDGDILGRLAERGAGYLHQMLNTDDFVNTLASGKGPGAIKQEFLEASEELLGQCPEPVEEVMRWLRKILHVEF